MICPESEAALCDAIKNTREPLMIVGGGTRWIGQTDASRQLSTKNLSAIKLYDPGALTIVVGAGTPLKNIQQTLRAENQMLPFAPPQWGALLGRAGHSTIGGVVSTNASGARAVQNGTCRDSLIGIRFVDGRGRALKNGGRVMKNVTGYDLVKLMAGARGSLGVLSEVAFKVLPRPEMSLTLCLKGLSPLEAVRAMALAMASPYMPTGAAHRAYAQKSVTYLRVEGFCAQASYRAERLVKALAHYGRADIIEDTAQGEKLWEGIGDLTDFASQEGDVWRIVAKPSDAPRILEALGTPDSLLDWAGGVIWALGKEGKDLRARLVNKGVEGHATLVRRRTQALSSPPCTPSSPSPATFQSANKITARISADLKAKFDPHGILNPKLLTG